MQKKPLKVKATRRIYHPKYPSFVDKNPLLHPETRPYPFTHKFIRWASTGGLASIMLFSGNELLGQSQQDSLYNPFPLGRMGVPYQPVSFGTGLPERLKSEEAIQAIRNAFADSGIQLDEDVWLKDKNIGVHLDGYSHKDEIGFLFIDHTNMDDSFIIQNENRKKGHHFSEQVDWYVDHRTEEFIRFINNKDRFISQLIGYKNQGAKKRYTDQLIELDAQQENEEFFNNYHLEYNLNTHREKAKKQEDLIKEIFQHIDERFDDSPEKKILLDYTPGFKKSQYVTTEFHSEISKALRTVMGIKSDEKFIKNYFIIIEFLAYNNGSYSLNRDANYLELKFDIMASFPLKEWLNNKETLDEYHDKIFVSLDEAQRINNNNKNGTQFIAPISLRDPRMIVPDNHSYNSQNLETEGRILRKEFNRRNGMTDEILSARQAEFKALSDKYGWNAIKDLPRHEKDSLRNLHNKGRKAILAKYEAMEQLTDEERAEFKVKFADLSQRSTEWRKARAEEIRLKTIRKLEEEVKIYIQWAKSQMGG